MTGVLGVDPAHTKLQTHTRVNEHGHKGRSRSRPMHIDSGRRLERDGLQGTMKGRDMETEKETNGIMCGFEPTERGLTTTRRPGVDARR